MAEGRRVALEYQHLEGVGDVDVDEGLLRIERQVGLVERRGVYDGMDPILG